MQIATAMPEDATAIATLHVRAWQAAYAGILAPAFLASLSVEVRVECWRQILQAGDSQTRVAVGDDASILGFVSHGPSRDAANTPTQGEIWALYVAPERWGQGVGHALLSLALRELRALGRVDVRLWVLAANRRAIRFYASQGFAKIAGSARTIELGGRKVDEIAYGSRQELHPPHGPTSSPPRRTTGS
jgi:ribosomal protein S18 acetylase RimI-like enzyme